jgi:hypothetical protein
MNGGKEKKIHSNTPMMVSCRLEAHGLCLAIVDAERSGALVGQGPLRSICEGLYVGATERAGLISNQTLKGGGLEEGGGRLSTQIGMVLERPNTA